MIKATLLTLAVATLPAATQAQFLTRANNTPVASSPAPGCGVVPSMAADAGFTTCALNYDFSLSSGAPSAWLDCADNDATKPFHWGGIGVAGSSIGGATRCAAAITQGMDPSSGQTVLILKWLPSYGTSYSNLVLAYSYLNTTNYLDLPPNFYMEIYAKVDASSLASGGLDTGGPNSLYMSANRFSGGGAQPSPLKGLEWDFFEQWSGATTGGGDAAIQNWQTGKQIGKFVWAQPPVSGSPTTPVPAGWAATDYHKYQWLVTSNGSSSIVACTWIDSILQECTTMPGTVVSAEYLDRQVLQFGVGNQDVSEPTSKDQIFYVQYFRVWDCANWALPAGTAPTAPTSCYGSSLVNGPPPALTYWH